MANGGNVSITIADSGSASIIVPGSSTQLVIGCSSSGTVGQIVATRTPATISTNFGTGPLVEAAGLACAAGGTVLAMRATSNAAGSVLAPATSTISTASSASPILVTTSGNHGLTSGAVVTISGVTSNTGANGTFIITVASPTTFTLNGSTGTGSGTGGTCTPTGVTTSIGTGNVGTSVPTVTGTPLDTYFVKCLIVAGGTVGTAGITYQLSADAGRNYGPVLALSTGTTIAVGSTGATISLTSTATLTTNQVITFSTQEPMWNTAGIQAALNAFQASQYAIQGVGSVHIVGSQNYAASGSNASTIEGYFDTLATGYVFTRAFMSSRDASPPAAYGGTAEAEATWISSIESDYSSVSARRLCVGGGYWNMPSVFPNATSTGASSYRRPIAWAAAAKQVTIPPQRHNGRVKDGSLAQIVVNSLSDPQDGFIYHDERINPGLDYVIAGSGGRFMSTMTRTGLPGVYISNPLSMAPLGSDFYLMPLGLVMDVFSTIIHTVGQQTIDDDVRINANGTIYENDARAIEAILANSVNSVMFAQNMISGPVAAGPTAGPNAAAIIVDRTVNVKSTGTVVLTGTILSRGYVLSITATLSYTNPNAAV